MKIGLFLIFMIVTIYISSRNLYKKGHKKELTAFILLMIYTTYSGTALLQSLPFISLVEPVEKLFSSIGYWLENVLDVKSHS
jgi:hypothetical protein